MTKPLLIRAAELLEGEARCLAESHCTPAGVWPAEEIGVQQEYDEMTEVAEGLREMADKLAMNQGFTEALALTRKAIDG